MRLVEKYGEYGILAIYQSIRLANQEVSTSMIGLYYFLARLVSWT